jgi:predicted DNA-binding protein (MmcQ/YjbR family)
MDVSKIKELIPMVKVEEVPPNAVVKVEYYEVEISTKYDELQITINFFLSSDSWASIKFYGPNPEASVESLIRDAIALIEKYQPKKTDTTETP